MRNLQLILCMIVCLIMLGCGCSSGDSPIEPSDPNGPSSSLSSQADSYSHSNRILWGLWNISISADRSSIDIVPQRVQQMHLNTLHLLQFHPCVDCLQIQNLTLISDNRVDVDVKLRHPHPGSMKYTGFDVRGIFISTQDYIFPISGRSLATGDGVARLLNPDGYTSLFNPTDFPQTNPPALGYIPGHLAPEGDLSATLNPYVAWLKDGPRRMYEIGVISIETIQLWVPDGPLEFGYAVDASWQLVDGIVTDPLTDFPPDANCLEAYDLKVWAGPGLSRDPGAWTWVYATISDHQGIDTVDRVTVEAYDVFSGTVELELWQTWNDEQCVYRAKVFNETDAETGDYPMLVRVDDFEVDQNLGQIDAWMPGILPVRNGWVMTWGDNEDDSGTIVIVDQNDNIIVMAEYKDTVDLDPTPGLAVHNSEIDGGCNLTKFDPGGGFEWTRCWDFRSSWDYGNAAVDSAGNTYVTSIFSGTIDFDPGPGTELKTAQGDDDMFLFKLDPSGDLVWTMTWEEFDKVKPIDIATVGSSDIYITGLRDHNYPYHHGFLLRIGTDGEIIWSDIWGGEDGRSYGYSLALDSSSNIYVTGYLKGLVDMDPGPGEDFHDSDGISGCYLSKFNNDGDFLWCGNWSARGIAVAVDPDGYPHVAGSFDNIVDFDPGPLMEVVFSSGMIDPYVSRFDPDGNFQWVVTWGGSSIDYAHNIVFDSTGNILVVGNFTNEVDFDPGPGVEERESDGYTSHYLLKLDNDADYQWVCTWGSAVHTDRFKNIGLDSLYNAYVVNSFDRATDFDPGSFIDVRYPFSIDHYTSGDPFLLKIPYNGDWW